MEKDEVEHCRSGSINGLLDSSGVGGVGRELRIAPIGTNILLWLEVCCENIAFSAGVEQGVDMEDGVVSAYGVDGVGLHWLDRLG